MNTPVSSSAANNPGAAVTDALLTTKDVAVRLKIHPGSVRRNYQRGLIRGVKLNARLLRFRSEDIDAYISGGMSGPGRAQ